jgi:hypothetical protein
MFGLFKSKPNPEDIFAEGTWQISKGESGGNPIVVRANIHLRPFVGHTDLTVKIGFAVPLNSPNEGGLPDPAENEILDEVEDRIATEVTRTGQSVQALAITTGTFKEFVFYARPGLDIKALHEKLMSEITTHEVQCYAEMDPDWATYKEFVV